ncbi:MAG: hypothetical protein ACFWUG_07575 [Rahnella inusitata]
MDKWVGLRSRSWTTDHTGLSSANAPSIILRYPLLLIAQAAHHE